MENEKKPSIKKCIVDLIEDSTMHGLPRMFKSKSWLVKIMWFFCFLGSTGYCVYLTLTSVFDFLDYDVVTSIETFREIPSTLPAITICNLNQYQNNNSFEFVENRSKLYKKFALEKKTFWNTTMQFCISRTLYCPIFEAIPTFTPYFWHFYKLF